MSLPIFPDQPTAVSRTLPSIGDYKHRVWVYIVLVDQDGYPENGVFAFDNHVSADRFADEARERKDTRHVMQLSGVLQDGLDPAAIHFLTRDVRSD